MATIIQSIFDTRTLLPALEQLLRPKRFLVDTFFKSARTFETKYVDIDIFKGQRRTAAYISPVEQGEVIQRLGFSTTSYEPPYIKEKMKTEAADMLLRHYGETLYTAETPLQRALRQLAIDMMTLSDMIDRAEEVQAAQGLFTGSVQLMNAEGLTQSIDFQQSATHKNVAPAYLWSDYTNSDPIKDLRTWRRLLVKDSGLNPDIVILGSDVFDVFINNPKVADGKGAISSIRVDRGAIEPNTLPDGATYVGHVAEIGCDIYTYDEWYVPPSGGAQVQMVPSYNVFMGSTRARMDLCYGPIKDMEALYAVPRFPKSWIEEDPSVRWLMIQSSPLLVPVQVDSFLNAKVV